MTKTTHPAPSSPPRKSWLGTAIRLAICLVALWLVGRNITWQDELHTTSGEVLRGKITEKQAGWEITVNRQEPRHVAQADIAVNSTGEPTIRYGLRTVLQQSRIGLIFAGLLLFVPVPFLQGVRFRHLVLAQAIPLTRMESVRLAFAGNFLNFAFPLGATGGDIFKAYSVSLHTATHKTEAVITVLLDRVIGLASMVVVVALITILAPEESRLAGLRPYTLTLLAALTAFMIVYLSGVWRPLLPMQKLASRWKVFAQLERMDRTARQLFMSPWRVSIAALLTVMLQVFTFTGFTFAAWGVGFAGSWWQMPEFFAYFAAGAMIQSLPGPPQGLGTVELAYLEFFKPFASASQVVCLALVARIIPLIWSIPGAYVVAGGHYKPKLMETAVAAMEEERPVAASDTVVA